MRDLAVSHWARIGSSTVTYSPADQYLGHRIPDKPTVVPAFHLCPQTIEDVSIQEIQHPQPETVRSEVPSSFTLCDQVYRAYQRRVLLILAPAMQNAVRKLVLECTMDDMDPALKATRMAIEDIGQE